MCVIGVWRHILDLWCVCVCALRQPDAMRRADAVHTNTTGPEYAAKHRSRT